MFARSVNIVLFAAKNIYRHFCHYILLFLALTAILTALFLSVIKYDNDDLLYNNRMNSTYNYHVTLVNIGEQLVSYLKNNERATVVYNGVYEIVKVSKDVTGSQINPKYDVYILLLADNVRGAWNYFNTVHMSALKEINNSIDVDAVMSPKYEFDTTSEVRVFNHIVNLIFITCLSVFLLSMLFILRIRMHKSQYCLYMTLGADYDKLFSLSVAELSVLTVPSLIIALPVSVLTAALYYSSLSQKLALNIASLIKIVPCIIILILVSAIYPMKKLSKLYPQNLFTAHKDEITIK